VHGFWEGYGGTRINYQEASIREVYVIDSGIHTDGIGRFGLCIGIDVGGPKGKRGQQNGAKDEPACSSNSGACIPGHR